MSYKNKVARPPEPIRFRDWTDNHNPLYGPGRPGERDQYGLPKRFRIERADQARQPSPPTYKVEKLRNPAIDAYEAYARQSADKHVTDSGERRDLKGEPEKKNQKEWHY